MSGKFSKTWLAIAGAIVVAGAVGVGWWMGNPGQPGAGANRASAAPGAAATAPAQPAQPPLPASAVVARPTPSRRSIASRANIRRCWRWR
ncbi:hypothetical protein AD428_20170 [Achromobacter sp. DMS1]|uniref:hypothetical protein n=1 Tax=Achromobacter sp. DMS1 TaxID=1688405 RepID=UPI00069F0B6E|nr:hypothetical protein AD428_20170 [Achromobacter sp. DMS1]